MSGEGGGVIIGGAIMLAVAPAVIAGATAMGVAYGALKMGGFLGKKALEYAKEKHREKELVVSQCSVQLESLYSQMQNIVKEETELHTKSMEQMAKQLNEIGSSLQFAQKEPLSAEKLEEKIAESREKLSKELEKYDNKIKNILVTGNAQLESCMDMIEKSNREKADLVQWVNTSETSKAMQKAAALEILRDAEASLKVLKSMADSSQDEAFKRKVANIEKTWKQCERMLELQMFEGAFSTARTVIRESAVLATEHVQEAMEMDMLEIELCARLNGLLEEMKAQRVIEFCDETKKNKKRKKADLNTFSQGNYKKIMEQIENELLHIQKNSGKSTVYELKKSMDKFEQELEPEARHVIERSKKVMSGYYERVHVLEVVADFMREQDYTMDWVMPVGGDASQKLVVHFIQNLTKNTISVTLENDVESDEIANMAMEILTFYGNGREVTEAEKQNLREHLTEAIHKAGFEGMLSCKGQVNQASARIEMNEKESVRNMPIKPIM